MNRTPTKRKLWVLVSSLGLLLVLLGIWRFKIRSQDHRADRLWASGTVETTEINLGSELSSKIVSIYAEEGDRVEKGELLIELDTALLESERGRAEALVSTRQAERDQAEIDRELKERDFHRLKSLVEKGGASQQQVDQAEAAWKLAKAQVELAEGLLAQAESSLHYVEKQIAKSSLYSPISGVVLSRLAEPGEVAIPGRPLMVLGDLDRLWVRVFIAESEIGKISLGQEVTVLSETYRGVTYRGRVSYIAEEAEFTPRNVQTRKERTRLVFAVKVAVENPRGELKPGLPVDVEIHL